jgi:uncharacterized protein YneF (UPF0154 family)
MVRKIILYFRIGCLGKIHYFPIRIIEKDIRMNPIINNQFIGFIKYSR